MRFIIILLCFLLAALPRVGNVLAVDVTPVDRISHIHGMAVDPSDSRILYVATHFGLIRTVDGKAWGLLGRDHHDFMGFSVSGDGKYFYASGHQQPDGKNLGLRRSGDGGQTWERMAFDGQVDFHTMTASPARSGVLYGWYGRLFRSMDGGVNWDFTLGNGLPKPSQGGPYFPLLTLVAHPTKVDRVWAGTEKGLYVSYNGGKLWVRIQAVPEVPVTAFAIDPKRPQTLYLFSPAKGMLWSSNEGKSWKAIGQGINDRETVSHFAIDPHKPSTLYAATTQSTIYQSTDSGAHWQIFIQ